MKKYKYYLIFITILLIIPFIYKATIKHKESEYKVNKYQIKESFEIKNKIHNYKFIIKKGKNTYSFIIENKVNKRSKIIKKIKEYKEDNITCIIPIYINDKENEIYCNLDNNQVSKEILKENASYKKIIESAKKYHIKNYKNSETKTKYKNINIYQKNIPDNTTLLVWNYKGIIIINNNSNKYKKFIDYDLYDNILATTTSRYFVLLENTSVEGIEKIHCYDLKKDKYKEFKLDKKIEKNSYINGVYNDLIYITDRKKHKQYTLNVKKEEIKEVGNEEYPFIKYENGTKTIMKEKDFFQKDQFFKNERITNKKISTSKDMVKDDNVYYYREDNSFYKNIENANKTLLFNNLEVTEWNIYYKELLLKEDDNLYLYNDTDGLRKLINYNELKYNDNNIYYIWNND